MQAFVSARDRHFVQTEALAVLWCLLLSSTASAQRLLEGSSSQVVAQFFDANLHDRTLHCELRPTKPALSYTFQFLAGYEALVPLDQFSGGGHKLSVLARITPAGGEVKEFAQHLQLPRLPEKTKNTLQVTGGFAMGPGEYHVEVGLVDSLKRYSRKDWMLRVEPKKNEREIPFEIASNTVEPLVYRAWDPDDVKSDTSKRITLFINVGPLFPGRSSLQGFDRAILLRTLTSLLRQVRPRSVRLVAFNLDQQKEILRSNEFDANEFFRLAEALDNLQLATVDYRVLQNKFGSTQLVQKLLLDEFRSPTQSDAIILLGPVSTDMNKPHLKQVIASSNLRLPPMFLLQLRPVIRAGEFPDVLEYAARDCDAKIMRIHSPADFAAAIQKMQGPFGGRELGSSPGSLRNLLNEEVRLKWRAHGR